ncbi:hypothetical protein JTB14_016064 [Gonioctena quinquepunctata]|nr:hypothetical protein JTB14_016064 [Gonioctena quinquepunctata]
MSIFGSPYSNSYNQDFDYDDEKYDDEDDKEQEEPLDESDEDTEDASETDAGRHQEPLEIKEQMYQDKLANLKKKLQQLKDGTHHEYNRKVRKLEYQYKERLRLNVLHREYMIDCVEREYIQEKKAAAREFEEKKIDLKENLISDLEDKKKTVEAERFTMELTGDSMEVKPVMTRKLRRRPNDPIPLPEKRRKAPTAQITYLLDEKEIENDLRIINKGKLPTPVRKQSENSCSPSQGQVQAVSIQQVAEVPLIETRIEDGKLLYEKRWYHRGQSVFVEGRDMPKFPANISAIGNDVVWVKKSDGAKIFPKNDHLKICMYANALLGVWPYIFEENPTLKKLYDIYSRATFTYYLLFILTAIIQLFILLTEDVINAKEIFANLSITLLYSVTIMRVYAIKSTTMRNVIREIMDLEKKTLESKDEKIIEIYKSHTSQSKISNAIFLVNIFLVTALYFIHPLFVEDIIKFDAKKNQTVVIKALPLSSWFPYDEQKYYLQSYLWHILDGCIGASFVTNTDIFTFSLIIFPLGQINILKHILVHFDEYAEKVKKQLNISAEEASFVTMRECILKHKDIIRYINDFNKKMRNIMVLDFLQSSLQLASIVIQLLVTKMNLLNFIYSAQFAVSMLIRLLVYYWYGNEIIVESSNLAVAIWESKWYEEPTRMKNMMLITMMRCKRVLCLEIGPFNIMSLNTMIGILKATYSYMMVIYRT